MRYKTRFSNCYFHVSSHGIWMKLVSLNLFTRRLTLLRYFFIRSSLASYVPFTWPITNWESPWTNFDSAPRDFANSNPLRKASYSTSLLGAGYYGWTLYFNSSPSGDCKTTPIPLVCSVDDPSTWMTHVLTSSIMSKSSWLGVNSAMKSTRTCAFIAFLGWYLMSNSLSSIAHWISHPKAFNLFISILSGWSVITLMMWAWK